MAFSRRHLMGGLAVGLVPLPARATQARPDGDGFVVMHAKPGSLSLVPKAETAILGYGGAVPGPLLRITKGQSLRVRLINDLPEPTSLSWHGVRTPNAMDGVGGLTQRPVLPSAAFDSVFAPPDSGLFWYHPHVFPSASTQTARGLYGVLIVDEAAPPPVDHDLLMVIDEWSLDAAGQIVPEAGAGSLVTVNSRVGPETLVARPGARVRLRLLNVSMARIALVAVAGAAASIIAVDGQPSELFQPARGIVPVGPGARFELMIDLPPTPGTTNVALHGEGEPDRPLMRIMREGTPGGTRAPIAKLPANPLLPTRIPLETSLRRDVVLGVTSPSSSTSMRWTINGTASDGTSGKPIFVVRRGGVVTLTFVNKTQDVQQMHIHGHVWRLLHDLDDGWDPYWRDCVLLMPGKTKHVAFVADNPGKWALGSSMLDRQMSGMSTWFEVT